MTTRKQQLSKNTPTSFPLGIRCKPTQTPCLTKTKQRRDHVLAIQNFVLNRMRQPHARTCVNVLCRVVVSFFHAKRKTKRPELRIRNFFNKKKPKPVSPKILGFRSPTEPMSSTLPDADLGLKPLDWDSSDASDLILLSSDGKEFVTDRSTIALSKHLKNVLSNGTLRRQANGHFFAVAFSLGRI
jgi:hypothetical protein